MSARNPPVGFKRETWRPQPTSSWTPGQADTFRPSQAGPSSSSYRPPSPQRGDYDTRPPRYPDGPGEPSRPPPIRDFRTQADRFGRPGPDDRSNGRSYRPQEDERRQYDQWRPGDVRRSPPRRNGDRFPGRNWRDRFDDDRPRMAPRDDRDRWRPPPRGHQDSYRPPESPPKPRGRRESPDYGVGRRGSGDELPSRRSRSPRERSPASATRKRPLSPSPAETKRQRQYSPPPQRGRNSSPVPSATSSRFRPSPSRSRSRGRYSVERSPPRARSPESFRTRSPAPSTRRRSPSPPSRFRRSPSPRIRLNSDRSYRSGHNRSPGPRSSPPPPPRNLSPGPRARSPISRRPLSPPTPNRGNTEPYRPPRDAHPPPPHPISTAGPPDPATPNRGNLYHPPPDPQPPPPNSVPADRPSSDNQFSRGPPPPNFAQHVGPPTAPPPGFAGQNGPPSMPPFSGQNTHPPMPPHAPFDPHAPFPPYTNGFSGPPPFPQVPAPPVGPIKIDFEQAAARRDTSPNKGGWKSINNGMPTKTAVQRMFDDGPSPPRAPRSMSPQRNGSPPSGPASERIPSPQRPPSPPSNLIAPYIETAFQQWASRGAPLPLRDFLVHYFGRPPDGREVSQMERLLEQSKAQATFAPGPMQNHWSPNRPPPARREPWGRRSVSPSKEASANLIPIGESRYGKPVEIKEVPPADVPPPKPPTVITPTEDVPKPHRKAAPGELYERLACVGEGTYGKVYKARNLDTGQFVALKRIRMEGEKDGFPVTAMREIKVLQSLKHPNVLRLIEMMVSKGSVYMVLEYMDHDLTGLLAHPEIEMSPANLKSLNFQMLSGLAYLHHRGILHRDMKGSNILLSGRGELKLADFGLARTYSKRKRDDYTNRVITLWYRSPELLLGETVYGPEVDTWSAGCIMLELFTSKPVFQGTDEISQLEVIYSILGTPSEEDWPGLGDLPWYELVKPKESLPSRFEEIFAKWLTPAGMELAKGLLTFNPSKRLSAETALQTAYFASEEPAMEMPTHLANCGEHHEMSAKIERHRRRQGSK